ncbi:hypothetical protein DUNSADRAFT_3044 [Dunaliella salina]|uniref:Uncharacterized protein n=1 Tax=Dunaliella salina TaxID=3046 RepID=A0ABQ7GUM0_DUNSA|nr:hypothetical protein DUNSADRAFT_3044 [Dunaliella salina]|eukprot:KAF5838312.1 hypothetical protein DUNSADRAFT_3044 [Dunaliella salina]
MSASAVEEGGATPGQGKAAKPPAGQDASKRMHDYLLNQKRRKEDYFLRKYGKVIQPPKEAVEPKERPITLPPLAGPHPGGPSVPIFQAKGPIATFPNNASVVIDKAQQQHGLDRHHKLADIHYRPVAPPAHQTPHLPPLPRSRERSREGSGPGTPVKEPSSLSAQQQQQQHLELLGGSPSAALPLLQQQQLRHAQLQQHLQQQQQRLQQQGVVDSSLLGRMPGEGPHGAMKQDGSAFPGGPHGLHAASPRSQRPQLDPLTLQPSQGRLQPLSRQSSRSRGLSNGEGSAGDMGRPRKTGMRDLEVELSVIKAIRSREEVVDRLRTATLKVDHALGGGSPLVLNLNDPLLKMFFRLVTQLRHRTLDTIEAIGAWHRRTDRDDGTPHSRAGSLAPLKKERSAWEGGASEGPSAPESPHNSKPLKHAHHQHQQEGDGREHGGVEGSQTGAAPKGVGFEVEGQVLLKEDAPQLQAGMPESDALDEEAVQQQQQQQQQQHAAQKGQLVDQLEGQHIAEDEGKDAGGVGEPEEQLHMQSSGLTADFFEREEQERLLQEQAAAAAAAEAAQQQQRLQEEWQQRDLADQRARQLLLEEEEREAARLREEEEQQRFKQAEEEEEERVRMEVEEHRRRHELSLEAQRRQLAERQKQQEERERQQAMLVAKLSAAQYARPGHPDADLETADEGVVLDSLLDAMVSSLEEPYSLQVPPGGFTYQGWVLDRQLSAKIRETGPSSPTPAERSQMREQLAKQHEQGLPAPLEIPSPLQQAPPSPPSPQHPSQSPQALQPSSHVASPITSPQHFRSHADHDVRITEGEGIHAEEIVSPARSEGKHAKGDMDAKEEHISAEDSGMSVEAGHAPPDPQPSFGVHPSTEPPTPHLTPHAIPSPALEMEPGTQFEVYQGEDAGGVKKDGEAALEQPVPVDQADLHSTGKRQPAGIDYEHHSIDQVASHQPVPVDQADLHSPSEQQPVGLDFEQQGIDQVATQPPVPVDQADLHLSGEQQPVGADYEQHDIDQVVSELVQDVDAGGGGEADVQESGAQDEQHQQQDNGQGSEAHEGGQESRGSGDRNGGEDGEEFDGSRSGEVEIKFCEDTRPVHQLNAAKQQHADLRKLLNAKAVAIHPVLLGVGGTIYTEHTLKQFKQLGLDHQLATKLAQQLHAHSVQYAHKLVTTRRAIENKNTSHSQVPVILMVTATRTRSNASSRGCRTSAVTWSQMSGGSSGGPALEQQVHDMEAMLLRQQQQQHRSDATRAMHLSALEKQLDELQTCVAKINGVPSNSGVPNISGTQLTLLRKQVGDLEDLLTQQQQAQRLSQQEVTTDLSSLGRQVKDLEQSQVQQQQQIKRSQDVAAVVEKQVKEAMLQQQAANSNIQSCSRQMATLEEHIKHLESVQKQALLQFSSAAVDNSSQLMSIERRLEELGAGGDSRTRGSTSEHSVLSREHRIGELLKEGRPVSEPPPYISCTDLDLKDLKEVTRRLQSQQTILSRQDALSEAAQRLATLERDQDVLKNTFVKASAMKELENYLLERLNMQDEPMKKLTKTVDALVAAAQRHGPMHNLPTEGEDTPVPLSPARSERSLPVAAVLRNYVTFDALVEKLEKYAPISMVEKVSERARANDEVLFIALKEVDSKCQEHYKKVYEKTRNNDELVLTQAEESAVDRAIRNARDAEPLILETGLQEDWMGLLGGGGATAVKRDASDPLRRSTGSSSAGGMRKLQIEPPSQPMEEHGVKDSPSQMHRQFTPGGSPYFKKPSLSMVDTPRSMRKSSPGFFSGRLDRAHESEYEEDSGPPSTSSTPATENHEGGGDSPLGQAGLHKSSLGGPISAPQVPLTLSPTECINPTGGRNSHHRGALLQRVHERQTASAYHPREDKKPSPKSPSTSPSAIQQLHCMGAPGSEQDSRVHSAPTNLVGTLETHKSHLEPKDPKKRSSQRRLQSTSVNTLGEQWERRSLTRRPACLNPLTAACQGNLHA